MKEKRERVYNNGRCLSMTEREKHMWDTFKVLFDEDCKHLSSNHFMNLLTKDDTISYTKEEGEAFINRLIKSKFLKPLNL